MCQHIFLYEFCYRVSIAKSFKALKYQSHKNINLSKVLCFKALIYVVGKIFEGLI